MTAVTREFVELYTLGLLTTEGRQLVEEAFDVNPEVQHWFLEQNALPDHVRDEERAESLAQLAAFRGELANPADRELFAFVAAHASSGVEVDPKAAAAPLAGVRPMAEPPLGRLRSLIAGGSRRAREAFADVANHCDRRMRASMDFTLALSAAPTPVPTFTGGPACQDICERDGDAICIAAPVEFIPNGLAWLGIAERDGTVTMHLPVLEKLGDSWVSRESIVVMLGGRHPVSPIEMFLVPATKDNVVDFDCEEVRRFINALPLTSHQRQLASRYLS